MDIIVDDVKRCVVCNRGIMLNVYTQGEVTFFVNAFLVLYSVGPDGKIRFKESNYDILIESEENESSCR